ncbi:unnamed protein product [Cyclocybe aegerita]|uniref:Uncharacterized protein n=1 Tax=Cyclocybe aegerita TaxID=1973307 RepID=A0A8S0VY04_CYCAE|nr:unnamed protein product [Cyclocybe aegerita]
MSPPEREIHVLRTRAALADSERRRCKEERKWAVSQGNVARAQQMKWEVKRYTDLMNTFNQEADMKAFALEAANGKSRTRYWSTNAEEQKSMSPSSKEKSPKSSREQPVTVSNALQSNERVTTKRQPRPKIVHPTIILVPIRNILTDTSCRAAHKIRATMCKSGQADYLLIHGPDTTIPYGYSMEVYRPLDIGLIAQIPSSTMSGL